MLRGTTLLGVIRKRPAFMPCIGSNPAGIKPLAHGRDSLPVRIFQPWMRFL